LVKDQNIVSFGERNPVLPGIRYGSNKGMNWH